jgi:hypothetical protein
MSKSLYKDPKTNFYVTIEERTETEVKFAPQGGGFVRKMSAEEFDKTFFKAEFPSYKPEWVMVEGFDKPVVGYCNGQKWNGWAMPYLPKTSADELCKVMSDLRYDAEKDAYIWEPEGGAEPEIFERSIAKVFDREVIVYAVGAGYWCWEIDDQDSDKPGFVARPKG